MHRDIVHVHVYTYMSTYTQHMCIYIYIHTCTNYFIVLAEIFNIKLHFSK